MNRNPPLVCTPFMHQKCDTQGKKLTFVVSNFCCFVEFHLRIDVAPAPTAVVKAPVEALAEAPVAAVDAPVAAVAEEFVVPPLPQPSGDLNADSTALEAWFASMFDPSTRRLRPIPPRDVELSVMLLVHHDLEVARCPKSYYKNIVNGQEVSRWVVNNAQVMNRFYYFMLCMFNCTGSSQVRGRLPVSPRYFRMETQNKNFCQALLEGFIAKRGMGRILHSGENFDDLFRDVKYATYNEPWRTQVREDEGFWEQNVVYPGKKSGPSRNFQFFYELVNFAFF